jgi:hypothetical protein
VDADTGEPLIAHENAPFDPVRDELWMRTRLMPVEGRSSIGEDRVTHLRGLFIIDVFAPKDKGAGEAIKLADEAMVRFKVDRTAAGAIKSGDMVVRTESVWRDPALLHEYSYQVPISVRWYAFTSVL